MFDSIGETYTEAFAHRPGQLASGMWLLRSLSGGAHPPIILDIGCGTGIPTARQLIDGGAEVIGIDTSPVMLDLARSNVPEAIFLERDLADLDGLHPVGERFDAAVAFFSLLVLPRDEVMRSLKSIRHVLRPEALMAVGMVEGDSDYLLREFLGVQVPLTAYPREELVSLLSVCGFDVLELTAEEFVPVAPEAPRQTHLYVRCAVSA